jgi:LysM repeat protein
MTATLHPPVTQANYALRRTVAGLLVVLAVVLAALAVSTTLGALLDVDGRSAAAAEPAGFSERVGTAPQLHVAQPGDTLWSIAERYRGDVELRRFVDALIDANGGTAIQAGQAVRLP